MNMPESFYYILLIAVIVPVGLSWVKSGTIINPVTFFNLWWGGFLFLSTLNLVGIRIPSMRVYYIVLLAMSMYSTGCLSFISGNNISDRPSLLKPEKTDALPVKMQVFILLQIAFTVFLIYYSNRAFAMMRSMGPDAFRALIYKDEGLFGQDKKYFMFIVSPYLYLSVILTTAGVMTKKISKYFLILSFFNLILYSALTAGRAPIFLGIMVLSLGFLYNLNISKLKIRPATLIMIAFPVIFIVWMSAFRKSTFRADTKSPLYIFFEYFVWYFTGPFTAFDYFMNNMNQGADYHYSAVRGVFAGIEELFLPVLKRAFPGFYGINESFHEFTRIYRPMGGPATHHNSHFTMLYTFMRDAGYLGVMIFSYIFGAVNGIMFSLFLKKTTIVNFSMLLILTFLSLMGIMRWELRYVWSWLTISGILLIPNRFVFRPQNPPAKISGTDNV